MLSSKKKKGIINTDLFVITSNVLSETSRSSYHGLFSNPPTFLLGALCLLVEACDKCIYPLYPRLSFHRAFSKGKANMMKDEKLFRVIDENCWSPEARIQDMNKTGNIEQLHILPNKSSSYSDLVNFFYRCNRSSIINSSCDVQLLGTFFIILFYSVSNKQGVESIFVTFLNNTICYDCIWCHSLLSWPK